MTYVIGLTGGIGSGKTVVSDQFETLGVPVIDTDIIARAIVEPGQPTLLKLYETFGNNILHSSGELNRKALRKIAFSSPDNKEKLDSITHPAIRAETIRMIGAVEAAYCIVVIPLLTQESPFFKIFDRIIVVVADINTKIIRIMQRSNISREETVTIINTQISDEERLTFADDIIDNNHTIQEVQMKVNQLNQKYLNLD